MGELVTSFDAAMPGERDRLGGKGDSLVAMRSLGLPVPPGFVLTTDVCRTFRDGGRVPVEVWMATGRHLAALEDQLGRRFGDAQRPLLLSVRSGAPVSMPGMMDTILNLGLTDATVDGLADMSGDAAFAWDSYSRLVRMYGITVRGMSAADFERVGMRVGRAHENAGSTSYVRDLTRQYLELVEEVTRDPFPQDPLVQLREAVEAVFRSWDSRRARRYRSYADLPDDLGTAVVVQAMVFGNLPGASGTGVAFTRDPATGAPGAYGDFLAHAQGEDVVAGEHDVSPLADLAEFAPEAHEQFIEIMSTLEAHYRDMCDIEFTVEQGTLWILQTRVGQRTAMAAVRIALDLVDDGLVPLEEALSRIPAYAMIHVERPVLDSAVERDVLGSGTAASPGAATGRIALSPARAEEFGELGDDAILVRPFTSPDDISGMIAARGVVTAHGGRTSHAAVVARGMNRPAVCGVHGLEVFAEHVKFGDRRFEEGDLLSMDGAAGEVYAGASPLVPPPPDPRRQALLDACDRARRLQVGVLETEVPRWADVAVDPVTVVVCRSRDDLAQVDEGQVVLVDPSVSAEPRQLLAVAAELTGRASVHVMVNGSWPPQVERLPAARWAGLVTDAVGASAARLLAANTEVPVVVGAKS